MLLLLGMFAIPQAGHPAPPSDEDVAKKLNLPVELVQRLQRQRGLNNQALDLLPAAKLPRVIRRLDYPDMPRERAAFRFRQNQNEKGVVPEGARFRALEQLKQMRPVLANKVVAGVPVGPNVNPKALLPLTAGVAPKGWVAFGPGNIGGRIRSLLIHPTNHKTMFAGSIAGGIWRTDDAGETWYPVNDFLASLAISCLVMNPTAPDVMYAGTGEGFYNLDALRGTGIFRSSDGGVNWALLPATKNAKFQWVNRLAVSADGKVLLAATRGENPADGGIFRSVDEGATWTQALNVSVADVDTHPTDPLKAVAAGLRNGAAYYSSDGGATWTAATHPDGPWSGRVEVTYAKKDPSIVYASVDVSFGEIWRSADGGKTYKRQHTGSQFLGEQGWYDNVIWAGDPTNADLVIVGGIDLWKSTDGGKTLRDISTWWASPTSAHADHHLILAHPAFNGTANKTVFFGNDGGLYRADNVYTVGMDADPPRNQGWKELNNTFGITQFYGGAGNVQSGVIIGGAQDNGTLRFQPEAGGMGGAEKWTEMFGGDGGFCAADPKDPNYFYGEYVYLNIHRSSDGGKTAQFISGQYWNGTAWAWKNVPYQIPDARNNQGLFIAPFVLDPNNAERILGGGLSVWRTNDAKAPNTNTTGPKWASIKPSNGSPVSAIAVAPGNEKVIWVGHENGDVFRTTDGTAVNPVWIKMDGNGPVPLPQRYCTRLVIDPNNHKRVFATFSGYSKDNVWVTTDDGSSWKSIHGVLPEAPVRALAIHHSNGKFLYVGTEVGIFASEDDGNVWSPSNEGPTNCSVDELFWMDKTLIAVTHGRGMFKISLP